jgi:hypothetical protein
METEQSLQSSTVALRFATAMEPLLLYLLQYTGNTTNPEAMKAWNIKRYIRFTIGMDSESLTARPQDGQTLLQDLRSGTATSMSFLKQCINVESDK